MQEWFLDANTLRSNSTIGDFNKHVPPHGDMLLLFRYSLFKKYTSNNSDNLNVFFFKGIVGGVGPPGFPGLRVSTLYLLRYGLVRIFVLYVCEIIFKDIRIQGFKQILFYLAMISIKITLQNCCHIPGMEYFCILHFWSGVSGVFLWNNKLVLVYTSKASITFWKSAILSDVLTSTGLVHSYIWLTNSKHHLFWR